jgi:hypothetical protein
VIRRSFRIGLRLGLFAGVVFAILKIMQARRPADPVVSAPAKPWPPVPTPAPTPAPAPPRVVAEPTPEPATKPVEAVVPEARHVTKKAVKTVKAAVVPEARRVKKAAKTVKKATKTAAKTAAKKTTPATRGWVEPQGQVCPLSHPIKAKMASRIYHLPGMFNYTRTRPDRCYASEAAAKRDGLASAKR